MDFVLEPGMLSSIRPDYREARRYTYTPGILSLGVKLLLLFLIVSYRSLFFPILGGEDWSLLKAFLWSLAMFFAMYTCSSMLSHLYQPSPRLLHTDDMVGFAKAGGLDIRRWVPVLAFGITFLVFCASLRTFTPDPIRLLRNPWLFLLVGTVVTHLLTWRLATTLFRARFTHWRKQVRIVPGTQNSLWSVPLQIQSCILSPDGQIAAAGYTDNTFRIWDIRTRELQRVLAASGAFLVDALAFSSDGDIVASGSWDGSVRLWKVRTGELQWETKRLLSKRPKVINRHIVVQALAFSPDGCVVASGGAGRVTLRDVGTGEAKRNLQRPEGWMPTVSSMVFSPKGGLLYRSA
jgi:hypothetical protein